MLSLKYWMGRIRAVWRPDRVHDEIAEEMGFHIERLTQENLRRGMPADQAKQEAERRFGHLTQIKEQGYEVRGGGWVESVLHDMSYGIRLLRRSPGLATAAILSLALGIGANTAIFSVIDALLLKALPVRNPGQLVFIGRSGSDSKFKHVNQLSYPMYQALRERRQTLSGICTLIPELKASTQDAEIVHVELVSGNYFSVLGVNAFLGRTFAEDDDKPGSGRAVAIVSHDYWERRLASDSSITDKQITLNGFPFTVVGVAPPDFFGATVGSAADVWAPSQMRAQIQPGRVPWPQKSEGLPLILARLAPGVSKEQATTVVAEVRRQFAAENASKLSESDAPESPEIELAPASHGISFLRNQFSRPLRVLMMVVVVVLLIACANVANLILARSTARKKEIAIHLSLGVKRSRLVRQLLAESLLLALAGGTLGLLVAFAGSHLLLVLVSSGRAPISLNLSLDGRALGFTALISVAAGILFGLAPALRSTRVNLASALNDTAGATRGSRSVRLGKAVLVAQVTLSLLLLVVAGLFVRTLERLEGLDTGFNREHVLVFSTDPRLVGYSGTEIAGLYGQILDRLNAIPGVRSASLSRNGLLSGNATYSTVFVLGPHLHADQDDEDPEQTAKHMLEQPNVDEVGPGFFATSGIAILRGREIGPQDTQTAAKVSVVNEAFAQYYFGNADPMGRHFLGGDAGEELTIVGLAADSRDRSIRDQVPRIFYVPYTQSPVSWRDTNFQVRTAGDPDKLIPAVREAVHEISGKLPVYGIKTLAAQVDENLVQERLIGFLSSFFALLSLLLAAIGLYGVMSYSVSLRTQEIGTRMALGAQRKQVVVLVVKQGMTLVLLGVGLGLVLSFVATRVIASQLFGIAALDPFTFAGVTFLFLSVALLACLGASQRAARLDPMIALRCE